MALIGKIRQNGWILIALMVLALGGFIIMDIVSNAQNYSSNDANTLGKVAGQDIDRREFETVDKFLFKDKAQDDYQARQLAWNYLVERAIVEKEADAMGLGVSKDELKQLMFGPENISQVVQQKYQNRQTGQVDFQQIQQIQQAIESNSEELDKNPDFKRFWAALEKEVVKDRLQRKLLNAVFKGITAPKWLAEDFYNEQNTKGDFLFVKVPYDKIPDEEAKPTDDDYKAFYDEAKESFRTTEEIRYAEYAAIDVVPTSADSAKIRADLASKIPAFQASTNDSVFCLTNNGYFNKNNYFKKTELETAADLINAAPVGAVVGPYFADTRREYRIAKVIDRKPFPDSVKARHILIRATNPGELAQANKTIDSLKNLIERGMRFDSLAVKNSQDPGSGAKGGDLGYFVPGTMVPEFNAVCCFTGTPGKLYKVATQFGVHLIDITDRKYGKEGTGTQLAYLSAAMEPSEATQGAAKEKALSMLRSAKTGDDLKKQIEAAGLKVMSTPGIRAAEYNSNFVNALGSPDAVRDMQRWAFGKEVKAGSVASEVFAIRDPAGGFYDAKYVVASLKSVLPVGLPKWSDLKVQMETPVKNRKKAAYIKSKIGDTKDLGTIAATFGVKLDTAMQASFAAQQIGKVGQEPKVNGTFARLDAGAVSGPIDGTTGVFVLQVLGKTPAVAPADLSMFKRQAIGRNLYDVNTGLLPALKKNSGLTDNRAKLY